MKKPSKHQAIALVVLSTLVISIAQILWKTGATLLPRITWQIPLGLFLYVLAAGILVFSLSGSELTILYPVIATSYIWVNVLSRIFFGEPFTIAKWTGIVSIILGIYFVARGGKS